MNIGRKQLIREALIDSSTTNPEYSKKTIYSKIIRYNELFLKNILVKKKNIELTENEKEELNDLENFLVSKSNIENSNLLDKYVLNKYIYSTLIDKLDNSNLDIITNYNKLVDMNNSKYDNGKITKVIKLVNIKLASKLINLNNDDANTTGTAAIYNEKSNDFKPNYNEIDYNTQKIYNEIKIEEQNRKEEIAAAEAIANANKQGTGNGNQPPPPNGQGTGTGNEDKGTIYALPNKDGKETGTSNNNNNGQNGTDQQQGKPFPELIKKVIDTEDTTETEKKEEGTYTNLYEYILRTNFIDNNLKTYENDNTEAIYTKIQDYLKTDNSKTNYKKNIALIKFINRTRKETKPVDTSGKTADEVLKNKEKQQQSGGVITSIKNKDIISKKGDDDNGDDGDYDDDGDDDNGDDDNGDDDNGDDSKYTKSSYNLQQKYNQINPENQKTSKIYNIYNIIRKGTTGFINLFPSFDNLIMEGNNKILKNKIDNFIKLTEYFKLNKSILLRNENKLLKFDKKFKEKIDKRKKNLISTLNKLKIQENNYKLNITIIEKQIINPRTEGYEGDNLTFTRDENNMNNITVYSDSPYLNKAITDNSLDNYFNNLEDIQNLSDNKILEGLLLHAPDFSESYDSFVDTEKEENNNQLEIKKTDIMKNIGEIEEKIKHYNHKLQKYKNERPYIKGINEKLNIIFNKYNNIIEKNLEDINEHYNKLVGLYKIYNERKNINFNSTTNEKYLKILEDFNFYINDLYQNYNNLNINYENLNKYSNIFNNNILLKQYPLKNSKVNMKIRNDLKLHLIDIKLDLINNLKPNAYIIVNNENKIDNIGQSGTSKTPGLSVPVAVPQQQAETTNNTIQPDYKNQDDYNVNNVKVNELFKNLNDNRGGSINIKKDFKVKEYQNIYPFNIINDKINELFIDDTGLKQKLLMIFNKEKGRFTGTNDIDIDEGIDYNFMIKFISEMVYILIPFLDYDDICYYFLKHIIKNELLKSGNLSLNGIYKIYDEYKYIFYIILVYYTFYEHLISNYTYEIVNYYDILKSVVGYYETILRIKSNDNVYYTKEYIEKFIKDYKNTDDYNPSKTYFDNLNLDISKIQPYNNTYSSYRNIDIPEYNTIYELIEKFKDNIFENIKVIKEEVKKEEKIDNTANPIDELIDFYNNKLEEPLNKSNTIDTILSNIKEKSNELKNIYIKIFKYINNNKYDINIYKKLYEYKNKISSKVDELYRKYFKKGDYNNPIILYKDNNVIKNIEELLYFYRIAGLYASNEKCDMNNIGKCEKNIINNYEDDYYNLDTIIIILKNPTIEFTNNGNIIKLDEIYNNIMKHYKIADPIMPKPEKKDNETHHLTQLNNNQISDNNRIESRINDSSAYNPEQNINQGYSY